MKRTVLITAIFVALCATFIFDGLHQSATSHVTGAPSGRAGDPAGGGATCSGNMCHSGGALSLAGLITTNVPASGYVPATVYNITATVTLPGNQRFGFEISPQNATGTFMGVLIAGPGSQLTQLNTHYITHDSVSTVSTNTKTWNFTWKSPVAGSGPVTFFGCFNATNNNNQNSGDTIIRTATVVQETAATGMASISNAAVVSIFPNPSNGIINVDFGFAEATGEFRIMDVTGKMVFNTLINETSGIKNIDASQLKNGIYFYELTSNGQILKNGRIAILK